MGILHQIPKAMYVPWYQNEQLIIVILMQQYGLLVDRENHEASMIDNT